MTNGTEYSFMRPYTRGSSDMDGLANALRRGEHEPLDKYKRDPYVELRCSIPCVKDRDIWTSGASGIPLPVRRVTRRSAVSRQVPATAV
jgi:hypothetical protein